MIDLHIHTIHSDGSKTITEILIEAEKRGIKYLSITDHNNIDVYDELKTIDIKKYYSGNIIIGCEFNTSFKGQGIEVLGYSFDHDIIKDFLNKRNTPEKRKERAQGLFNNCMKIFNDLGIIYDSEILKYDGFPFIGRAYQEIIKHESNVAKINEDIFGSLQDFVRKGVFNPNSKIFLNHAALLPSLEEIINLIHSAGGVVFLAHPFEYNLPNLEETISELFDNYSIDGIEAFYTTNTEEQTKQILEFANERKLLICGGSDSHGENKKDHEIGVGAGNLNISSEILENWPIDLIWEDKQPFSKNH